MEVYREDGITNCNIDEVLDKWKEDSDADCDRNIRVHVNFVEQYMT